MVDYVNAVPGSNRVRRARRGERGDV